MYISVTDARLSKETNYLPELWEVVIYYIYQEDRGVSWIIFYQTSLDFRKSGAQERNNWNHTKV